MKSIVGIIVGIVIFSLGFWLDSMFISFVLAQFPPSAHEWLGLIKVGLWFLTFAFTFAVSLMLAIGAGSFVTVALQARESRSVNRKRLNDLINRNRN